MADLTIRLYTTSNDSNKLIKTLVSTYTATTCFILNETEVINPIIDIEYTTIATIYQSNYCQVALFGRYYFITKVDIISNKICRISLKCDVLMSYSTQILLLDGIIERQEKNFNVFQTDPEMPTLAYQVVQTKLFPNNLMSNTNHHFVLKVAGGN